MRLFPSLFRWLLAAACLAAAPAASAWDDFGHMMVAALAYDHLDGPVHRRVTALLKLNPDYGRWVGATRPGLSADKAAFIVAATWADAIKRAKDYQDDGDRPSGPDSARNIGYADKLRHRYWHYIDVPFSTDGTPLVPPGEPNAATQIDLFRASLRAAAVSDDIKSYDLVWLLHLVGDIHQPLHAISRFSRALPSGDQGGNKVALCAAPCKDELHVFWDTVLGMSEDPLAASKAARRLTLPSRQQAGSADVAAWVEESVAAARASVYVAPIGDGAGPYELDDAYRRAARARARQRVALAGLRLAHLLNEALQAGPPIAQ